MAILQNKLATFRRHASKLVYLASEIRGPKLTNMEQIPCGNFAWISGARLGTVVQWLGKQPAKWLKLRV